MSDATVVRPVNDNHDLKQFIMAPWTLKIYENDPAWVPPLIRDQKKAFHPKKGYFFEIGEAQFFLAYRSGKLAGRISAHRNRLYEEKYDTVTGFFGFFECVNDLSVAESLIDQAALWLKSRGKSKIQGPQSFSIYDQVGFEVFGEQIMPSVGLLHTASYYGNLVEKLGFAKRVDWHCFLVKKNAAYEKYLRFIREKIMQTQDIQYKYLTKRDIERRSEDIHTIFNLAWRQNWGHLDLTKRQIHMLIEELKLIAVPELSIFAEKDGKTVGFIISLPDINPGLRRLNGRLHPWKLPGPYKQLKTTKRLRTIIMGVLPEFRGLRIDDVFYLLTIENGLRLGYTESDCSLIVETNRLMINALKPLMAEKYKTFRIYERDIH
jgi:hypothetical protein